MFKIKINTKKYSYLYCKYIKQNWKIC